jgi:UDP-3-O-[3-hydroxymyristoyl] glucosamine N-acyltransferase
MTMHLSELAERLGATIHGGDDGDPPVRGVASLETAGPDDVAFLANARYRRHLATTRAAAIIVAPDIELPPGVRGLVCDDPYFAFRNALIAFRGFRRHPDPIDGRPVAGEDAIAASPAGPESIPGAGAGAAGGGGGGGPAAPGGPTIISERAAVHPEATVGAGAHIHPFVTVEAGAVIGARTVLYPGVSIGARTRIGDDCILYPNVVVYEDCEVGDRVALHANTVIGQDGFGYATHRGVHHKIPQTGRVVIEDDVELGAGNAIERAAMGETRIGAGTKFADLISIGHGTVIGRHCLLVSLVGVSGSVTMGDYVVLGGQVGVAGHLEIGTDVQVAGQSGIASNVPSGARIGGVPAVELPKMRRNLLVQQDLGGLARRVKDLERANRRDDASASASTSDPPPA